MTPKPLLLIPLVAVALVALSTIASGHGRPDGYEVWTVDQSNSAGKTTGGTLYVYNGRRLRRDGAATTPEKIDLGGAAEQLCLDQTGTAPVRPHMLLFNASHRHAILSFVASGHVVFFDAARREPLACIDVGIQAHAAVPTPDQKYVLVSNQNGKLLQRIKTDYVKNRFTLEDAATLDLANGLTPAGAPRQDPALRPDNAPICTLIESNSRLVFVTLRGGGLFVVDLRPSPMRIVAEYDKATIHGNGCGGIQTGGKMYVNSGGGTMTNLSQFDVYAFRLSAFSLHPSLPNLPAPKVVFSAGEHEHTDSHGATLTGHGRYLWVADRMGNRIVVIDTRTDRKTGEFSLVGSWSDDPSPDLMDPSPSGRRVFVTLRGSIPLSGDPHASTGSTPGLCVLKVKRGGRTGEIKTVARIANVDLAGIERADPHALRVRRIN
jgi:DNA-binding beta-propeller fold protein YncE